MVTWYFINLIIPRIEWLFGGRRALYLRYSDLLRPLSYHPDDGDRHKDAAGDQAAEDESDHPENDAEDLPHEVIADGEDGFLWLRGGSGCAGSAGTVAYRAGNRVFTRGRCVERVDAVSGIRSDVV